MCALDPIDFTSECSVSLSLGTAESFPVVASLSDKKRRPEIRLLFAGYIAFKTRYSCLQAFKFALWRLFIDFCFFWSKKVRETQKFTQITKWLGELRRKDVTIIPSLLFHLRGYVAQRKWNFPFLVNGKEKSPWRIFFAILIFFAKLLHAKPKTRVEN